MHHSRALYVRYNPQTYGIYVGFGACHTGPFETGPEGPEIRRLMGRDKKQSSVN
jgi:hypothetical protein